MHPDPETGTIIYRSGMNPKIRRNFEIFTPCDFIAAITQHIPDKSFQLVRYYGWYSNKMRGQRAKQAESREGEPPADGIEIIDVSEHRPRRPPILTKTRSPATPFPMKPLSRTTSRGECPNRLKSDFLSTSLPKHGSVIKPI